MTRRPTCNQCGAPIVWYQRANGHGWARCEPKPVVAHEFLTVKAHPIFGEHLWEVEPLIEHLQLARGFTYPEARSEVDDLLWVTVHHCHLTTTTNGGTEQ